MYLQTEKSSCPNTALLFPSGHTGNSTDSPGPNYLGRLRHRRITTHSACIIHALLCPAELQGELNPLTAPRHGGMLCLTPRNTGALSEQMLGESPNQTHRYPARTDAPLDAWRIARRFMLQYVWPPPGCRVKSHDTNKANLKQRLRKI